MNSLINEIENGTATGPLVPYDPDFGVGAFSGLMDVLVELDPEASNKFPPDEAWPWLDGRQRAEWTAKAINSIQDALQDYPGWTFLVDVDSDGTSWYGLAVG